MRCCISAHRKSVLWSLIEFLIRVELGSYEVTEYFRLLWIKGTIRIKHKFWSKTLSLKGSKGRLAFRTFIVLCFILCPACFCSAMNKNENPELCVLCFLFILAGSKFLNQFFVYIAVHCISLHIFLNMRVTMIFISACIFVSAPTWSLCSNHWLRNYVFLKY